ncbi:MAG: peroxiredoxin family protein [Isosphaerales bacterium]
MKKLIQSSALIAVVALSAAWAGWKLHGQRPTRPVAGSFHQSKVDGFGHTRGIVQVDLMRQIMAEQARSTAPAIVPEREPGHHVPSQDHPLLGRPAPALVLEDTRGKTWNLREDVSDGPVVVVFYLGATCMACMTHLVELDVAISRFHEQGARVLAVSGDAPEFSRERIRKFGGFQIPLLSDSDHATSLAYGVWKAVPGGDKDDGEAQHGTFIVDRDGLVRWAHVGNRPFTDIEALLTELSHCRRRDQPAIIKKARAGEWTAAEKQVYQPRDQHPYFN